MNTMSFLNNDELEIARQSFELDDTFTREEVTARRDQLCESKQCELLKKKVS